MTTLDLFDRLWALPHPVPDIEQAPPIELVAVLVGINRRVRGWKQRTLADFAGVSLSTVERVERGERVSLDALDKITVGLGLAAGYFTTPRRPRTTSEMESDIAAWPDWELVDVALVRTQAQLRELARCPAIVVLAPDGIPEADVQLLRGLAERLDFLGFVLSAHLIFADGKREGGRRPAYEDVLNQTRAMCAAGYCVVAGVTTRPTPIGEERVALFSVSVRAIDPGATARKKMFVDRRQLTSPDNLALLD